MKYDCLYTPPGCIVVARNWRPVLERAGLLSYNALMRFNGGTVISQRPSRAIIRLQLEFEGQKRTLYLKRHHRPHLKNTLGPRLLGQHPKSEGRREWEALEHLRRLNIPVMSGIAMGEATVWGIERGSFILVKEVPGVLADRYLVDLDAQACRALIDQLAQMVQRMHQAGWHYPDLVFKHLYFHRGRISLIDMQRLYRPRWWPRRALIKELAVLNVSFPRTLLRNTQRLRFFKTYLGVTRLGPAEKKLGRSILQRCRYLVQTRKKYRGFFEGTRHARRGKI